MRNPVKTFIAALAISGALVPFHIMSASAADMVVMEYQDGTCSQPKLIKQVTERFATQAREVHHQPDLAITSIYDIHEHRYVGGEHKLGGIDRRYCGGTAQMSDGRSRTIWFLIEYGMGFASIGDTVEFCISGLDRWNVYNAACRVLR